MGIELQYREVRVFLPQGLYRGKGNRMFTAKRDGDLVSLDDLCNDALDPVEGLFRVYRDVQKIQGVYARLHRLYAELFIIELDVSRGLNDGLWTFSCAGLKGGCMVIGDRDDDKTGLFPA